MKATNIFFDNLEKEIKAGTTTQPFVETLIDDSKAITMDDVEKMSEFLWNDMTNGFQESKVRELLRECDCHETQKRAFNCICQSNELFYDTLAFEGQGRVEFDLLKDNIGYKYGPNRPTVPHIIASGIDPKMMQNIIANYQRTIGSLTQELEANRQKEKAQKDLIQSIEQKVLADQHLGEENTTLKATIKTMESNLKNLEATLKDKDQQIAHLEAKAKKVSIPTDKEKKYQEEIKKLEAEISQLKTTKEKETEEAELIALNRIIKNMVTKAKDWTQDLRSKLSLSILAIYSKDIDSETHDMVKALLNVQNEPTTAITGNNGIVANQLGLQLSPGGEKEFLEIVKPKQLSNGNNH